MPTSLNSVVYLRPETRIEPLCCRWYAWSHLVTPVQQAFNVTFRQLPLLRSFLEHPLVHLKASRDASLYCGPFVHLRICDTQEVEDLISRMIATCHHLICLANALVKFGQTLRRCANGGNLDILYNHIPESLAGAVEIVYDLENRPTFRILEALLDSDSLRNDMTQEIMFFQHRDEVRNFFLNTPRLDGDDRIFAPIPFNHSVFDYLSQARIQPIQLSTLTDLLQIPEHQNYQFSTYFTEQAPERHEPIYMGDAVRLRYFGHASILLQSSVTSILVDPTFSYQRDETAGRLVFSDIPDFIDYVFITHGHPDHLCPEVLLQLRNRVGQFLVPRNNPFSISDPSLYFCLKNLGFQNVVVFDDLSEVSTSDTNIMSIPFLGEHSDLSILSKHCLFVEMVGRRVLFLADSACLDRSLYKRLAPRLGTLDALFIGMECEGAPLTWLYGPYLSAPVLRDHDESRRLSACNFERARAVVEELKTRRVFVYAMGQEPWLKHLLGLQYGSENPQIKESDSFVRWCSASGTPAERLYGGRQILL